MTLVIVSTIVVSGLLNLWLVSHLLGQGFETRETLESQLKHLDNMMFKYVKTLNEKIDLLGLSLPRKRAKEEAAASEAKT